MSDVTKAGNSPVAIAAQPGAMLDLILQAARDPAIDVSKLQAMLSMQLQLEDRQAERLFNEALARVTMGMPRVTKRGTIDLGVDKTTNKHRGSMPFARWEDVDAIIRPRMEAEGFTLSFDCAPRPGDGGGGIVTGTLLHRDGHKRSSSIPLPLDTGAGRNNLQAMGSTLSYGKRYLAEMLLNIVRENEDDDGKLGGTQFITEAQKSKLIGLIVDTQSDTARFCATFKVRSIDELEAKDFQPALNMLEQKKAKMGKPT